MNHPTLRTSAANEQLAQRISELMTETEPGIWTVPDVLETALVRGLLSLAYQYGVTP